MENFAVVSVVNGVFHIDSEWGDNLQGARIAFHQRCANLWNASEVAEAVVRLVNKDFVTYTNYYEGISHPQEEPTEE